MATDKLTDKQVSNTKPSTGTVKLADGGGLILHIEPNGSKLWRLRYRHAAKEKMISLGAYPAVSLKEARKKRDEAKAKITNGIDPAQERRHKKNQLIVDAENTFETVAREWYAKAAPKWKGRHKLDVIRSLENDVFPRIGKEPITSITASMLKSALLPIEARGALETLGRVRQRCEAIFDYAFFDSESRTNPARALKNHFASPQKTNFPALSIEELPEFLEKVGEYNAHIQTRLAIKLMALTFVRTGELLGARWDEINPSSALWEIPAERMKMKLPHTVPLATQSLKVLHRLKKLAGASEYVFPKRGDPREIMSNATILRVIERIGYKGRMTGHGFRTIASTTLNESGHFRVDVIERQLAHVENNKVRKAYNKAEYLGERREMMQWWADYLDTIID